jgi:Flp pilus assembly protein TadD
VSIKGAGEDDELLNNPYLLASPAQKIATEIATLLNYIKLLIFPHPLSADYSFHQIPYKNWGNPLVWLSIAIHGGLIVCLFKLFKKRHILSFAIAFYLLNLLLVSNLLFSIGATMGERLIYHSSLGFCIAVAFLLNMAYDKIKQAGIAKIGLAGFVTMLVLLCGAKTIARNADWKNNSTLYIKDVETSANSALANGNAGASYNEIANLPENADRRKELLQKSIGYLNKAIAIHSKYTLAYMNRGTAYFELGDLERAKQDWDSVKKFYPTYPTLPELYTSYYINNAINKYGSKGKYDEAIAELKKGTELAPKNAVLWYNIAYYYSVAKKYDSAIFAWQKTIEMAPDDSLARKSAMYIQAVKGGK